MGIVDNPQPASAFRLPYLPSYNIEDRGRSFTSPNRPSIPPFPDPVEVLADSSPSELRSRRWSVDEYPYLAFLPMYPFIGSIMSVFATPVENLRLERSSSGKWRLPYDTAKQWKETEHTIRKVTDNLLLYLVRKNPELTDLWALPAKPGTYGYFDQHSSENNARTAVHTSVDAFVVSATHLSFVIALCQVYPASLRGAMLSRVFEDAGVTVHVEWLETLQFTWIANFGCDSLRLGCIIDVHSCKWLNLVPYMIKVNIPVWFYWGYPPSNPKWIKYSWIAEFAPEHPKPLLATQSIEAGLFPPVEALSGQKPGETMRAFFSRRKEQYQKDKKKESYRLKQVRWAREKAQAGKKCPGKRGPNVFAWEKVGQAGVRIRTLLTRQLAEHQWNLWAKNQKFYDSFANEWDCCSDWSFEPWQKGEPQASVQTYCSDDDNDNDNDNCFSSIYGPGSSALRKPDILYISAPVASTLDQPPLHADTDIEVLSCSQIDLTPHDRPPLQDDVDMEAAHAPSLDRSPFCTDTGAEMLSCSCIDPTPPSDKPSVRDGVNTAAANIHQHGMEEDIDMRVQIAFGDEAGEDNTLNNFADYAGSLSDEDMDRVDLLDLSTKQVLAMNPIVPTAQAPPKDEVLDELIYYRYGYSLLESPYRCLPSLYDKILSEHPFNTWSTVWRTLGVQQVSTTGSNINPICEFLAILLASERPFHDIPGEFWDLSPINHRPLKAFLPLNIRIETRELQNSSVLCFIHSRGDSLTTDSLWIVAVQPFIALECVRRSLGPNQYDAVEFLVENGIPCHTLCRQTSNMTLSNVSSTYSRRLQILGPRPLAYKFGIADYAAYETLRDSFLLAQPCGRRALCFGGIIARLARESLPTSVALSGPSTSAFQGDNEAFEVKDAREIFFDDALSEEAKDLICGTYSMATDRKDSTAYVSWYPRWNVWEGSGLNVCHWSQECEDFYLRRRADILAGKAVPLSGTQWRQKLRFTRHAPKLIQKMNTAAVAFLQSSQGDSLSGRT